MCNYLKFLVFIFSVSGCSISHDRLSSVAKLNENNQYVNNYIDEYKVSKKIIFNFFWKNIFNPSEKKNFKVVSPSKKIFQQKKKHLLTWSGHSTFLYQNTDINILVDPHFTSRASPFKFLGPKRFIQSVLNEQNIPEIDIVAISHNHYDHLDLKTIKVLNKKFPNILFLVPLGLKKWFLKRKITNVKEFDWWEGFQFKETKINFVPVQHWSKRTLFDRNKSLWGGWWFEYKQKKFLHLGDTGYTKDFLDIKKKLGSPDIVAIPIGSYEPRNMMKNSHLNPKEAVQTFTDLDAKMAVAMHWGTFILSHEPVDEPVRKLKESLKKNKISNQEFRILKHGETIFLEK